MKCKENIQQQHGQALSFFFEFSNTYSWTIHLLYRIHGFRPLCIHRGRKYNGIYSVVRSRLDLLLLFLIVCLERILFIFFRPFLLDLIGRQFEVCILNCTSCITAWWLQWLIKFCLAVKRNTNLIKGIAAAAVPAAAIGGFWWKIYNACEAEVFGGVFEMWPFIDGLWESVKCLWNRGYGGVLFMWPLYWVLGRS
jgi:hypothetical protein